MELRTRLSKTADKIFYIFFKFVDADYFSVNAGICLGKMLVFRVSLPSNYRG